MKLLACLMLDRSRIILQAVDMPLEGVVFGLQIIQLPFQCFRILLLLFIRGQPILTKHDVVSNAERQSCSRDRRKPSPLLVDVM